MFQIFWFLLLVQLSPSHGAKCFVDENDGICRTYKWVQYIRCFNVTTRSFLEELQVINRTRDDSYLIMENINFDNLRLEVPNDYIKRIYIYNNDLGLAENAFQNLKGLEMIEIHGSNLGIFNGIVVENISRMKSLNLSGNDIYAMSSVCKYMEFLHVIDMSRNRLTTFEKLHFYNCMELLFLDLSFNQINDMMDTLFNPNSKLVELNMANNFVDKIIETTFSNLKKLKNLNLSGNKIRSIFTNFFVNLEDLVFLDLSRNQISHLETGSFNGLFSMIQLILSDNQLKMIPCEVSNASLGNIRSLDLKNNSISQLEICTFKNFESLVSLDLSSNQLSVFQIGTFSPLLNLKFLNLSSNKLIQLGSDEMFPLVQLQQLDIGSNKLKDWSSSGVIDHMHSIKRLDLSNNSWDCDRLKKELITLYSKEIDVKPKHPVYHEMNVNGIGCVAGETRSNSMFINPFRI